jgi:hypothetical protein
MSELSPRLPPSENQPNEVPHFESLRDVESSPCPRRSASSAFLATPSSFFSTAPSIPAVEIDLEASPSHSEIASFPHHVFKHSLRFATPPKTKPSRKAWWWKKGLRVKEKDGGERLRWVCRLCARRKCRRPLDYSFASDGTVNIERHLLKRHGICVSFTVVTFSFLIWTLVIANVLTW